MTGSGTLVSSAGLAFAGAAGNQTSNVAIGLIVGFVVLDIVVIAICVIAVRGRHPPR
jgi:hypothetical protein